MSLKIQRPNKSINCISLYIPCWDGWWQSVGLLNSVWQRSNTNWMKHTVVFNFFLYCSALFLFQLDFFTFIIWPNFLDALISMSFYKLIYKFSYRLRFLVSSYVLRVVCCVTCVCCSWNFLVELIFKYSSLSTVHVQAWPIQKNISMALISFLM